MKRNVSKSNNETIMKISVVINTYNAEKYLYKVLESVKGFDEIVICDMYSDDATLAIAKEFNAKVVMHEKVPFVEPARNFAVSHAAHPWVLVIDADEIVPAELKEYLYAFCQDTKYSGVRIPFKNFFMNKLMRSAYPDYHIRFFKRDGVHWPPIIHSKIQIEGEIFTIPRTRKELGIHHIANDDVSLILRKNHLYSTEEIERKKDKQITLLNLFFSPLFWFVKYYFIKLGILDGIKGFIFAKLKSQYKFNTLAKVYEYQQNQKYAHNSTWNAKYARASGSNKKKS